MRISKRNLKLLVENYLSEVTVTGSGGYEYEKRGNNVYMTKNKGEESNYRLKPGSSAYKAVTQKYPELLPGGSTSSGDDELVGPTLDMVNRREGTPQNHLRAIADAEYPGDELIKNQKKLTQIGPAIKPYPRGKVIEYVQEMLGLTGDDIDGVYGPNTSALVQKFKKAKGIDPGFNRAALSGGIANDGPGVIGMNTAEAILELATPFQADLEGGSGASKKKQKKSIEYFEGFDKEIFHDPFGSDPKDSADARVGVCTTTACAQWVSNTFGKETWVGNAWHAHKRFSDKGSALENLSPAVIKKAELIFNKVNEKPIPSSGPGVYNGTEHFSIRKLAQSLIPEQSLWMNLELGDIVGLYYHTSYNFTKSFYEFATGKTNMGDGGADGYGPLFRTKKDKKTWDPSMKGKKIEFEAGNALRGGKGFGMTTHIGFVGAKQDGVPIIYHNVGGQVMATGLNAMSKTGTAIMFAGTNPKKP